jgi:predicted acyl esterase
LRVSSDEREPGALDLHHDPVTLPELVHLLVQIQSTWFPVYDRNPQTWVPNIFKAKASDFKAQTHRVWHTAAYPSRVEVMVQR